MQILILEVKKSELCSETAGPVPTLHRLSEAFDRVPNDLLWEKLIKMECHPDFVRVLKALNKDSYVTVLVNGWPSGKIFVKSGVKQGCPLSLLLFNLFLSDIGCMLEQSNIGTPIWGKIISALLFVDDLVLIGRNKRMVEELLLKCLNQFEFCGLEINCSKSNILSREAVLDGKVNLSADNGSLIGDIELSQKYKYLGITIGLGRTSDIF